MNRLLNHFSAPGSSAGKRRTIAVAYDESPARRAFLELRPRIAELSPEAEPRILWWRFDELLDPAALDLAITQAAAADVVVVATIFETELPKNVKALLERWVKMSERPNTTLVALQGIETRAKEEHFPVHEYLAAFSQAHDVRCVERQFELEKTLPACSLDELIERANARTPTLEHILSAR